MMIIVILKETEDVVSTLFRQAVKQLIPGHTFT